MKNTKIPQTHNFFVKYQMKNIPNIFIFDHSVFLKTIFKFKDEVKDDGLSFEKIIINIELLPLFEEE